MGYQECGDPRFWALAGPEGFGSQQWCSVGVLYVGNWRFAFPRGLKWFYASPRLDHVYSSGTAISAQSSSGMIKDSVRSLLHWPNTASNALKISFTEISSLCVVADVTRLCCVLFHGCMNPCQLGSEPQKGGLDFGAMSQYGLRRRDPNVTRTDLRSPTGYYCFPDRKQQAPIISTKSMPHDDTSRNPLTWPSRPSARWRVERRVRNCCSCFSKAPGIQNTPPMDVTATIK